MRRISGAPPARWRRAQVREARAWERMGLASRLYLARRGAFLDGWIRFWMGEGEGRRILEIGGAGLPAVPYVTGFTARHEVDPLCGHYARIFDDAGTGGRGVLRERARAEELPYPGGGFDAVVMLNVLDHVGDPDRVLAEVARVLDAARGYLFLSCDTYAAPWLWLRRARLLLRGRRNNDVLHPHHFTLRGLVERCAARFRVLEICNRHGDPLAAERVARIPYPGGGAYNRLKCEGRAYLVLQRAS